MEATSVRTVSVTGCHMERSVWLIAGKRFSVICVLWSVANRTPALLLAGVLVNIVRRYEVVRRRLALL